MRQLRGIIEDTQNLVLESPRVSSMLPARSVPNAGYERFDRPEVVEREPLRRDSRRPRTPKATQVPYYDGEEDDQDTLVPSMEPQNIPRRMHSSNPYSNTAPDRSREVSSPCRTYSQPDQRPIQRPRDSPPTPNDIVILVMGITGSGKTSFIQHFATHDLGVGHGLESKTNQIEVIPCEIEGSRIFLIDSPGFDDTHRSDTEILREVADWLNEAYRCAIQLTGIIYLHRIIDPRVGGSGMKNLRMFRMLCGNRGLASVALVTTMWNLCDEDTGAQRERQLTTQSDMWKSLLRHGSHTFRQDKSRASALSILSSLITAARPVTLEIQHEMGDLGLKLSETAAGREVQEDLEKMKLEHRDEMVAVKLEMQDAIRSKDAAWQQELQQHRTKLEKQMRDAKQQAAQLEASREKLRADMKAEHEAQMAALRLQVERQAQDLAKEKSALRLELKQARDPTELNDLRSKVQKLEKQLQQSQQAAERRAATYFSCQRCGLKTTSRSVFMSTPCVC